MITDLHAATASGELAACKSVINAVDGQPVGTGLRLELDAFRHTFTTADMREGTDAFLAKRTPVFRP